MCIISNYSFLVWDRRCSGCCNYLYSGFFPVILSTVSAVGNVDPIYGKIADSFEISSSKRIFTIVFPAIFSQVANALRLALGTCWIFLVSGEMVGSQSGLGFLVMDSKNIMRFDALLAAIISIGIIGFVLDSVFRLAEKKLGNRLGLAV